MSILFEHYGGAFPFWLSPVQVKLLPIADRHLEFALDLKQQLETAGIRVELDDRGDRLPAKIRTAQLEKVPHMVVIGDQELEAQKVNVRTRDGEQVSYSVAEYLAKVTAEKQVK